MRIAQVSTLATPVRQTHSGSIESVVWLLTQELTRMGHQVTVFGAGGSQSAGETVATLPGPYARDGSPDSWYLCEWINLCRAVEESGRFDVLHTHAYLWGLPLQPLCHVPMVHTLHISPSRDEAQLRAHWPGAYLTAISRYQWSDFPDLPALPVIHHAVDSTQFPLGEEPSDYLCFLGRFLPGKGPLKAIAAAKSLGMRLVLAGPQNAYYTEHIAPLVDGTSIVYAGSVTGRKRADLLGRARAMLYPIEEPEPFGLVMPEAMMCGTPVVATSLGAVPEIVDEGVTGYYASTPDEFAQQLLRALSLDRKSVRARAEERFSGERMAREYLEVYNQAAAGAGSRVRV